MNGAHLSDEQLSAHADGALAASESGAVAGHLFECSECNARLEGMRAASRAVASLPMVAPPRRVDLGFLSGTTDNKVVNPRRWRPPSWAYPVVAAAAALVIAVPLVPLALRQRGAAPTLSSAGLSHQLGAGSFFDNSQAPDLALRVSTPAGSTIAESGAAGAPAPLAARPASAATPAAVGHVIDASTGAEITISAPASMRPGEQVHVSGTVRPGGTTVDVAQVTLLVSEGSRSTLARSRGGDRSVAPGEVLDFEHVWTVNAASGYHAPGRYRVSVVVTLSSGSTTRHDVSATLEVSIG